MAQTLTPDLPNELRTNLEYIREDTLGVIELIAALAGYVWLWLNIWPVTGRNAPLTAWIGSVLLLVSAYVSARLKHRYLRLASYGLVCSLLISIICAIGAFQSNILIFLVTIPVIFASILLSQRSVFLVGSLTVLSLVGISRLTSIATSTFDVFIPATIVVLQTMASWLSARNLRTTLEWFSSAYQSSYRNEKMAREQGGELRRVLKALDDMTYHLERTNYTLKLERDQAQEARRLKQQFAQSISHELRTPLNLIVAFTELMAQNPEYYGTPLPPPYMRDLSIVYRNARHLQTLVNDVLDLAWLESAQVTMVAEETDLDALVRDAVNTARSLIEMRGLSLMLDIAPDLPPVWLDPIRIRQVLFNLLNNASRFTPRGSVTTRVRCEEGQVVISVQDTGIGIAAADIPRLFQEFQQLDGTTRRQQGGAGLGLAISKRFVGLHQGRIWAESEVGVGSTFTFTLPVAQEHLPIAADPIALSVDAFSGTSVDRPVVLVVTPSLSAATLLNRHLTGCRTVFVQHLDQLPTALPRLLPQLIVVDTVYQDLLPTLAKYGHLTQIPVVTCPLPGEDVLKQHFRVDGYLVKPISLQNVKDTLHQFVQEIDRILIVDDDADFVRLLVRLLNQSVERYQVMYASSGTESLALAKQFKPDLVFLDRQLPDMACEEVIERLRAGRALPIIMISAQDQIDYSHVMNKPLSVSRSSGLIPSDVIQLIQDVLEMTRRTAG